MYQNSDMLATSIKILERGRGGAAISTISLLP